MSKTLVVCSIVLALFLPANAAPGDAQYTSEQLALGTIRSILSAQAVHKKAHPERGYACDVETLVKADLLSDALSAGKAFNDYVFAVWCEAKATPQTTFRASALPSKKAAGSRFTVCTDETNVPRTIDGDAAACFANGRAAQ